MKNLSKIFVGCLFAIGCLAVAAPAKAFYFEMPPLLKAAIDNFKFYAAEAQENTEQPAVVQPQAPSTCMVNGVEQPGSCEQYNNQSGQTNQPQPGQPGQPGQPNQMNQQPQQGQPMNQPGPSNEQMLKDMKRGVTDVERQLNKFELMLNNFKKKGTVISSSTDATMIELKGLIQKFKSITSAEELQDMDMNELWDKMRSLEEERRNLEQMDNIMREMKRIESGIKTFEGQMNKLAKKKIIAPAGVTDNLAKIKALIAEIKSGKMDNAQDIFDLMQELDQNRGLMEMMVRWPQTLKQVDREIKNLEAELKRDKVIVTRLNKKGIDLLSIQAQLEEAIKKLKEVRDEAKAKIAESPEDSFDLIQNDFFGQMDDVWENSRIINAMNNFAQFQANSTREMNKAQQQINALKKKKVDTAELQDLLTQAKAKVTEVKGLFKVKPLDPDAVIDALSELQSLNQDFGDKMAELTGTETAMPWETGPQQFQQIQVSPSLDKLIPRPAAATMDMTQTCNINGVEVSGGACQQ